MSIQFQTSKEYSSESLEAHLKSIREIPNLGFYDLPYRNGEWKKASTLAREWQQDGYQKLIVLGMGGSSLGGRALVMGAAENTDAVEFWNNLDPWTIDRSIHSLGDLKKTKWLLISKSGGTLESLSLANLVQEHYKNNNTEFHPHLCIVTEDKPSALKEFATKHKIQCVTHPMDIGGRFSALSVVGLIPAAFAGVDMDSLKKGAQWGNENPEFILNFSCEALESFAKHRWVTVFWPYCDRLKGFADWLVQLWAESLGKAHDRKSNNAPQASFPTYCMGSSDQHSVLQQLADGPKDKLVVLMEVLDSGTKQQPMITKNHFQNLEYSEGLTFEEIYRVQCQSTYKALQQKGAQVCKIELPKLTAFEIGSLIMQFEWIIAVLGEAHNINAYDQPGVELGKILANEALTQQPRP